MLLFHFGNCKIIFILYLEYFMHLYTRGNNASRYEIQHLIHNIVKITHILLSNFIIPVQQVVSFTKYFCFKKRNINKVLFTYTFF